MQMKSSDEISGGEHVARALEALGVSCVFAVASVHNLPIVDAIERSRGVRIVMTRHEQGRFMPRTPMRACPASSASH
jgi:thiamine pyrophosphate-dependent acetolactate synthase large subunit-like protein